MKKIALVALLFLLPLSASSLHGTADRAGKPAVHTGHLNSTAWD
ncbi:hypothetical protein [Actinoplanes subglobosus]|uniref:Uncharacterized protein n=1 Tax=Actinoplanes subglobosus TaxID=1547892 RepID=A0ABV8ITD7_9ACTN